MRSLKESIINTYRNLGIVLAETLDPKHWRTWPIDPNDSKKGTFSAQKTSSQQKRVEDTMQTTRKRTRVTKPAKELGIKGTQTHHTTTRDSTSKKGLNGRVSYTLVDMLGRPLETERRTSVKGSSDGKQIKVPKFPTKHSSRKDMKESILNTYRSIGAVLAEARRGAPDEDSDKAAEASKAKADKRRSGKVKPLTDFERENLKSMGGRALRKKTRSNLEDTLEDET